MGSALAVKRLSEVKSRTWTIDAVAYGPSDSKNHKINFKGAVTRLKKCPTKGHGEVKRQAPAHVSRFLGALGKPTEKLREDVARNRQTIERSLKFISSPWEFDEGEVDETREITFLRDFFNIFHDCMQTCDTLDVVRALIADSLADISREDADSVITFWSESYLNEVYIFNVRIQLLLKYVERKYKKDADFTEWVIEVCAALREHISTDLGPVISTRGAHVHERLHRHADPELSRLYILNTCIDVLGMQELRAEREVAIKEAEQWLHTQVKHFGDRCWFIFDNVCEVLAEGIVTDNDWVIVPMQCKDDPMPFKDGSLG